jgi:exonuclease V
MRFIYFILEQVIERVDIAIRSAEESWAVKFMNFIVGTNQLLFNGLTRELPVYVLTCFKLGTVD